MQELGAAWQALKYGGAMVYPLLVLGVLAIAIIIDRSVLYARCLRMPAALADLVETFGFSWTELEKQLKELGPRNAYGRFLQVIADNRNQPAWWVESRAGDEKRANFSPIGSGATIASRGRGGANDDQAGQSFARISSAGQTYCASSTVGRGSGLIFSLGRICLGQQRAGAATSRFLRSVWDSDAILLLTSIGKNHTRLPLSCVFEEELIHG